MLITSFVLLLRAREIYPPAAAMRPPISAAPQSELDERSRRAAEWSKHCAVVHAKETKLLETINARCIKSGCNKKFGTGCPRSEHRHGGCAELIKHHRRARDEENRHAS